jgi:hypothetical protein
MRRGVSLAAIGLLVILAGAALQRSGYPYAHTFFYLIAWAGTLLLLDGLNYSLSRESLLLSTPGTFFGLYVFSVPWWLVFECLNFRIQNWYYEGLPASWLFRWGGYALAFGTVLPAVYEARALVAAILPIQKVEATPFRITGGMRRVLQLGGIVFLVLPLAWPAIFFPLVWGFAFLLFEPVLSREAPLESFLFDLSMGSAEAFLSRMGGGMLCGVLWEAFNYWAGGRWVYTVPGSVGPKIFEMPLLGYLGFAPFALECAGAGGFAVWAWSRMEERGRVLAIFLLSAFCALAFTGMDRWTVLP